MARVLFVCLGNICRSPTAHAVFREFVARAGHSSTIEVDSCGTTGFHAGEPADPRTEKAAKRRGYDLSRHRARQLEDADFERFDLVLAMDRHNLEVLRERCPPAHAAKVGLFLDHAAGVATREVPDPYYGGPDGFDEVLDLCEAGARGLLERLRASR